MVTFKKSDGNNVSAMLWTQTFPSKHNHEFYEIVFVIENSITNVLDGEKHVMNKGDICFIKPENVHSVLPTDNKIPSYFNIILSKEMAEAFCSFVDSDYLEKISSIHYATLTTPLFEEIKDYLFQALKLPLSENNTQQFFLKIAIIKILMFFSNKISEKFEHEIVKKDLCLSAEKLMQDPKYIALSVKDIANMLGYSHEHLTRSFKLNKNVSPSVVFNEIKLKYASSLLIRTDMKVVEIAEKIGFYSVHHFVELFKNQYGMSPNNYRKMYGITLNN